MSWEEIDFEETHGILLGYRIYYRLAGLNASWSNVSVTNLTGDVPVLSLRSYELRVCGFTRVGNGVFSPILIANSSGFGEYVVFCELQVLYPYYHLLYCYYYYYYYYYQHQCIHHYITIITTTKATMNLHHLTFL